MLANSTSIYFVSSTRHLLWANAIAENTQLSEQNVLILADSFNDADVFLEIIQQQVVLGISPFCEVFLMQEKFTCGREKNRLKRFYLKSFKEHRQLALLRKVARNYKVNIVLTSEVNDVFTQYLLNEIRTLQGVVQCHYIEDGLFSYIEKPVKQLSKLALFKRRLKYGRFYQAPFETGAAPWVSDAWVVNPDLVTAAIKEKNVHAIALGWFESKVLKDLRERFFRQKKLSVSAIKEIGVLLILDVIPNMKKLDSNYLTSLGDAVKLLIKSGFQVVIKPHPRDKTNVVGLFEDALQQYIRLLPKGLPTEFIIPLLSDGAVAFGDASSAFVDLRLQRQDVKLFVVETSQQGFSYQSIFNRLGIKAYSSYRELVDASLLEMLDVTATINDRTIK